MGKELTGKNVLERIDLEVIGGRLNSRLCPNGCVTSGKSLNSSVSESPQLLSENKITCLIAL